MFFKIASLSILLLVGLSGCLSTQTKTGLARPDFSGPAPVKTGCCCHPWCFPSMKSEPDLTTPPEPKKGKKPIGELPEYQDEDQGPI